MTHPPNGTPDPGPARDDARQLLDALAVMFHDEAAYGPKLTLAAAGGITLLSGFLSTCLGHAQPAAIPTKAHLAETLLALHVTCRQLSTGLNHALDALDHHRLGAADPIEPAQVQTLHLALHQAGTTFLTAAMDLAVAHQQLENPNADDPNARHP